MFRKLKPQYIFFVILLLSSFLTNYSKANLNSIENELIKNSQDLESNNRRYQVSSGDVLNINFVGISEFSGDYFVGPDGFISLPELRGVYVQDMTINEIYLLLNKKYWSSRGN